MNCINFPKIFKGNSTMISEGKEATKEALRLLLSSETGEMFGDPDFGITLKKYTFEQNNYILRDILIDEIYVKICTFCPQIFLERKNIEITFEGKVMHIKISYKNRETFTNDIFNLELYNMEDR